MVSIVSLSSPPVVVVEEEEGDTEDAEDRGEAMEAGDDCDRMGD